MKKWKSVRDYEGVYEVSYAGEIRSLDRFVNYRISGVKRNLRGRKMKLKLDRYGYLNVCLCNKNKKEHLRVHILVLENFTCVRPRGLEAAHIDGNKTNNSVENLRWVTHKENESHKIIHGTLMIGNKNHRHRNYKNKKHVLKQGNNLRKSSQRSRS